MSRTYKKIHPNFRLNGVAISYADLNEVSYSLLKEGNAHEKELGEFLLHWIDNESHIQVRTSGSTGIPKTIVLKKQHMVNSAMATGNFFRLNAGDSALLCLSGAHIAGKMMLVRAMVLGLDLDWVKPTATPLTGSDKDYDFCAMVPVQVEQSLPLLHRIKTLIVGGAPLSLDLKEKLQRAKAKVFETYGMTETITHIAIKAINLNTGRGINPIQSHFKVLPGVSLEKDKRNCLVIDAPELNDKKIITNDIVNLISETEFDWLGRYDNVINSGGVKLIPEQIELKLAPIVKNRFFVTGVPDEKFGQKLILLVEGQYGDNALLEKIKALETLAKYEVPKDIIFLESFVETENGKISRKRTLQKVLNSQG